MLQLTDIHLPDRVALPKQGKTVDLHALGQYNLVLQHLTAL